MSAKALVRGCGTALVILATCGFATVQGQTVVLVRHAERAGGMSAEAALTEAGRCRAEALAKMLVDAGVKRIYATEAARTQQTAAPLAKELHIRTEVLPAKDIDGLAARLRSGGPGSVALAVGHSDTVPEIIRKLGGGPVPPIGDGEYDRMFIVTLTARETTVVTLHYPGCAGRKPAAGAGQEP